MEIREYCRYREEEILRLYGAVGWTAYTADPEALRRGFSSSLLTLGAYEEDELLGVIRLVGDGETIVFIQDLLVFPERQRRGVGTALVKAALERYPRVRQIRLVSDDTPDALGFYRSLGFRDDRELSCRGLMYMGPRAV
ncbi:MAG: GNAT family N-acetyltransferase [Clostridia bacterium]|nr:GNAT family N-acetyltransferase [Clostridia bacterium]